MKKSDFGSFCWNELATPQLKKAKEFYNQLFGWQYSEHNVGEMCYTMIHNGEHDVGGIWEIPKEEAQEIPPHWLSYVLVEDIDVSLKKANDLGAVVKLEKTTAGDYGLFAVIADPTGAHFALWQSSVTCKKHDDKELDRDLEDTFPASDPTGEY